MTGAVLSLGLAFAMAGKPAPPLDTAADAATLRDGTVVLGQVVEPAPRGSVVMIVRRGWAEAKIPELLKRWESEEGPARARALKQRRERLAAWKRDRAPSAGPNDRILAWIDQELVRLGEGNAAPRSPLLFVTLRRSDVRGLSRRPDQSTRLLRLGWRADLPNPETSTRDALKNALEGRGFDLANIEPVGLDDLLPIAGESQDQWLLRRAATEAMHDPGVKFIEVGPLVVPEPVAGQPLNAAAARPILADLSKLLEGGRPDAVAETLREVAARGGFGAVVTRQEISPDLDKATVEIALWVRNAGGRWGSFGSRASTVRTADLKDDDVKALADAPQVQALFEAVESLGLAAQLPEGAKRASVSMGAAARKALGQARSAFQNDLAKLALPLERGTRNKEKSK